MDMDPNKVVNLQTKCGTTFKVSQNAYKRVQQHSWYLDPVGSKQYLSTYMGGKKTRLHRFIMGVTKTNQVVDHIDGNPLNNTETNLRTCTAKDNSRNKTTKLHTSQYLGVFWRKDRKKWSAQIAPNGKRTHLGNFNTEHDAAIAYNQAATSFYGSFAKLNQVVL